MTLMFNDTEVVGPVDTTNTEADVYVGKGGSWNGQFFEVSKQEYYGPVGEIKGANTPENGQTVGSGPDAGKTWKSIAEERFGVSYEGV